MSDSSTLFINVFKALKLVENLAVCINDKRWKKGSHARKARYLGHSTPHGHMPMPMALHCPMPSALAPALARLVFLLLCVCATAGTNNKKVLYRCDTKLDARLFYPVCFLYLPSFHKNIYFDSWARWKFKPRQLI